MKLTIIKGFITMEQMIKLIAILNNLYPKYGIYTEYCDLDYLKYCYNEAVRELIKNGKC